ncbi:Uncharacterised protein [uncultured archaeon]|nr:Uncharacterised protein [uncultured archaeon]
MRTIIAGSRDGFTYEEVCEGIKASGFNITTVISGTARGVDNYGERWARENGIPVERYPADWVTHGKSAGYKRNELMALKAGIGGQCLAFWYKKTPGTGHMIDIARRFKLRVYVVEKN